MRATMDSRPSGSQGLEEAAGNRAGERASSTRRAFTECDMTAMRRPNKIVNFPPETQG